MSDREYSFTFGDTYHWGLGIMTGALFSIFAPELSLLAVAMGSVAALVGWYYK